jgi:hypothetical protein
MASIKIQKDHMETVRIAIFDVMDYMAAVDMRFDGAAVVVANVIANYYSILPAEVREGLLEDIFDTIKNACAKQILVREGDDE